MAKTVRISALITGLVALITLGAVNLEAQRDAPLLSLVGPGSSIGLVVSDGAPGVTITQVRPDSPAARSGFRAGDVVTEFDGERARSAAQFTRLVRETAPGRSVKVTVQRDGAAQTLDVTPEARGAEALRLPDVVDLPRQFSLPRDFAFDFDVAAGPFSRRLGVTVVPLTPQLASYFGVERGLLVSDVASSSPAESAGIKAGDIITAVNDREVATAQDVVNEVREAQEGATIQVAVTRDRRELTLPAKLPERARRTGGPVRSI